MIRPVMSPPPSAFHRWSLALLGAATLVVTLGAQQPAREYYVTDPTGEVLPKFKAAADAKNYDAAIALLDAQLAKVPPDSFDAATLYQLKVQALFQKGEFSKAIEPMERALALSESKTPTYFEARVTRDLYYYLTQLYVQDAVQSKDKTEAAVLFEKADANMKNWLKYVPKSSADGELLYAQLLYSWAVLNPNKPDLKLMQRSLDETERGLHLAIHPKDTFYVLKLAALQQLNRPKETADMFELLIKQKPDSAAYYPQLAGTYLSMGNDLRAAMTIERAQAHGHMNTPQYYYNLVGIYFNIGQYEKAADLLSAGLKSGNIENELKNWELYALCYQQLDRPLMGIEVLKQASKNFPNSGQVEFMIGQAYYGLEKPIDALAHLQAAVAKGNLTKPHQVYMFLAYVAFELKKFDISLAAAKQAAAQPEGAKDPQTRSMIKAIEETMKDREEKKAKL